jgi:hypothetical protein
MFGRVMNDWPLVVGVPVPTVPIRTVPAALDIKSWPPKTFTLRKFVGVETKEVEVVAPKVAYRIPPVVLLVPEIQRSVPLVLVAPRGLPPEIASDRAVEVSIDPAEFTLPITRFTVAEVEVVMLVPPTTASYPGTIKN